MDGAYLVVLLLLTMCTCLTYLVYDRAERAQAAAAAAGQGLLGPHTMLRAKAAAAAAGQGPHCPTPRSGRRAHLLLTTHYSLLARYHAQGADHANYLLLTTHYYLLLTTHYSLVTMLSASANTLEMPRASTCVVVMKAVRSRWGLGEVGDFAWRRLGDDSGLRAGRELSHSPGLTVLE
eukprot:scaffold119032_cov69-Phaeocystis_antarctica.AAC.5